MFLSEEKTRGNLMKNKTYLTAIAEQSAIMILLIIFFNLNKDNHIEIKLSFFNIWFVASWIMQFSLLKRGIPSLKNISLLQLGAKITQKEHEKHHKKDKWGDNSYANLQHNLTAQKLELTDRNFDTMATFFVRLAYMLFGPIIFLTYLAHDQVKKYANSKLITKNKKSL